VQCYDSCNIYGCSQCALWRVRFADFAV